MKSLFKNKNYFLLFQGSLVSAIGNSLYSFAAGLYVQDMYKLTDPEKGALYLTLFMFIGIFVQVILSPIGGVIADKLNKVRILYLTDWIRGILFVGTYFMLKQGFSDQQEIRLLLVATFVSSVNQAFFQPASTSIIPEVVGDDLIQQANGANSIIQSVQTIFGVIAGIFLYELLGFEIVVLLNACSFMLSAVSEMFIRTPFERNDDPITFASVKEDFVVGLKFIRGKEGFLTLMLFSLALNFSFTPLFALGIPYLLRTELLASTIEIGIVEVVFSIAMMISGVVVGSITIKNLNRSVKIGIISLALSFVFVSIIIGLVTYEFIGFSIFYGLFIFANILLAGTLMYTNVPLNTAMMKAIDKDLRGRVFGTLGSLSQGAIPFSILIGGFILNISNTAFLGLFCSVLVIVISFVYMKSKPIYNMLNSISMTPNDVIMVEE